MDVKQMRRAGFEKLERADTLALLTASGRTQEELFEWARDVRREEGAEEVLLRGVIEVSNVCQKSCEYCAMRAANRRLSRYTLESEQILELADAIRRAGIGIVMLQGGQHPRHEGLLETVIPAIRHGLGMGVVLCMGERDPETFRRYRELGADAYILKFETSDYGLYHRMTRNGGERRVENIEWARSAGLRVGTGNIVGLPRQSLESLVDDVYFGVKLEPDFISSAPFVPNPNTPYESCAPGSVDMTLNTLALYRIALGRPLIPSVSALQTLRPDGQVLGLRAGANAITVNFTPRQVRGLYRIYSDSRFVVSLDHARRAVARAGLGVRTGGAFGKEQGRDGENPSPNEATNPCAELASRTP